MESAKDYLQAEVNRKLAESTSIVDGAKSAVRPLSDDEKGRVETLLFEVRQMKARIEDIEANESIQESIEKMRGPVNQPAEDVSGKADDGAGPGDLFVKSDAFHALQTAFKSGGNSGNWTSGPVEIDTKATVTTTASPIVQPDFRAGINPLLMRRLTIADLLASGTTDSGVVRYVNETNNTNAAAPTAEGDEKPESTIIFNTVDEPVRKIATFLPISDEMLEDASQIRSYLNGRLALFVQHAEEVQLLTGNGTAPNLRGLLQRVGIQTATKTALAGTLAAGGTIAKAIYLAMTNIRVNANVEPDGVVMHPTNYAQVRLAAEPAGAIQGYNAGGPFGPWAGDNIWGLPVAVTSAIALNTALVGAFGTQAQLFRRGGLTVEASNSHADFFRRNLTAIRAEERLALAVYRPAAFHAITALNVDE